MNTLLVFECVDVSATLAATWLLLRFVVSRPAVRWKKRLVTIPAPVEEAEPLVVVGPSAVSRLAA